MLLLGGGHAHLGVLRAFATQPPANVRITLVTPYTGFLYSGMLPGLVAGHYAAGDCSIALEPLARRAGVRFVLGTATSIDAASRCVTFTRDDGRTAVAPYDVLSVDVGGVIDAALIHGAREHALSVRPIEPFAERLGDRLHGRHAAPRNVVVVGGGAGGFELALALRFRLGKATRVHLVTGSAPLLPSHPAGVRRRAERALQQRGVVAHDGVCVEIGDADIRLRSGSRIACDMAVLAIGASAPTWLRTSGLALDGAGFVATGATLQSLSHSNVFAAGDVASRPDAPHPRSGVYAVRAGAPLAHNLGRALEGGALADYQPQRLVLNLLSCGERQAIAAWGAWSIEGHWVWQWKNRIDRRFVAVNRAA